MKRVICSILCSLVLTACPEDEPDPVNDAGGGGGDAGVVADSGATADPGIAELAAAVCSKQKTCCARNTEREEDCRASITRSFGPIFTLSGIELDRAAFARCLTRIEQMSCDEAANYAGRPSPALVCEVFYRGTGALDAPCGGETIVERFYDEDRCESGSCAVMKCAPRAQLGADCMEATCAGGLICHQAVCRQGAALGADCSQDGLCAEPNDCFGQPLTCQAVREIGAGEVCDPGTRCVFGESQCFCPLGQEGCAIGRCGNRSRCLN